MSKAVAAVVAKPSGTRRWKKSSGSAPEGRRTALTLLRTVWSVGMIAPTGALLALTGWSGWPLAVAQMLYSAAVMGCGTPLNASVVISVGNVPKPGGVLPVFRKRKFGWLKAFRRSTLKLMRRFSL